MYVIFFVVGVGVGVDIPSLTSRAAGKACKVSKYLGSRFAKAPRERALSSCCESLGSYATGYEDTNHDVCIWRPPYTCVYLYIYIYMHS